VSTWIKLHDNFWRNPKILAAGEDAGTLYVQGLCYCSDGLTDGRIPTAALRTLTAKKDARTLARILVREGLWLETATGWEVHDYLAVQRSRAQVESERQKARDRKARSRSGHAVTPPVTDGGSHAHVTQPETETETDNPSPTPPPAEVVTGQHEWQRKSGLPLADAPPNDPYRCVRCGAIDGECNPFGDTGRDCTRSIPGGWTIDPSQVAELRAVRGAVFRGSGLPDTSRSERGAPASPLPPVVDQPKGRSE
jgi:hypothetical protein